MFAPRTNTDAPLMRNRIARKSEPSTSLLTRTYSGSVSFPVVKANVRKPKRRVDETIDDLDAIEADTVESCG